MPQPNTQYEIRLLQSTNILADQALLDQFIDIGAEYWQDSQATTLAELQKASHILAAFDPSCDGKVVAFTGWKILEQQEGQPVLCYMCLTSVHKDYANKRLGRTLLYQACAEAEKMARSACTALSEFIPFGTTASPLSYWGIKEQSSLFFPTRDESEVEENKKFLTYMPFICKFFDFKGERDGFILREIAKYRYKDWFVEKLKSMFTDKPLPFDVAEKNGDRIIIFFRP